MSRRIAHRPRYRSLPQPGQMQLCSRRDFFQYRWSYRRQSLEYEPHSPGYSLTLIPLHYRWHQYLFVHQAS